MGVRSSSHGYDLYAPVRSVLFHEYAGAARAQDAMQWPSTHTSSLRTTVDTRFVSIKKFRFVFCVFNLHMAAIKGILFQLSKGTFYTHTKRSHSDVKELVRETSERQRPLRRRSLVIHVHSGSG